MDDTYLTNYLTNFSDELNVTNMTVWEYLERHLGPQHMPVSIVLPITIVYVLIFISGFIGNGIVCAVISRNSHFQTPTDYYLFSLAISDLLILIFGKLITFFIILNIIIGIDL